MFTESVMLSTILSSALPFCCFQYFPVPGSFPMSRLFASGGQSIGTSHSASVLPMITELISFRAWSSLIAQLVKNPPAMQETQFNSWVRKIHWRRDRLPTPVSLGFLCGSTVKESACNAGDLGSIPG